MCWFNLKFNSSVHCNGIGHYKHINLWISSSKIQANCFLMSGGDNYFVIVESWLFQCCHLYMEISIAIMNDFFWS